MSIRVMAEVWDLPLSSTEKLVLLALADCANDEGDCWPSIATLGRKASVGERSVQRSIQALKEAGHLTRIEVTGRGCRYRIHPRQCGTPARVAPVTNTTPPPPQCHPTPATVAPKPSMNHQEPSEGCASGDAPLTAHEVLEGWNELANTHGLASVRKLTDARRRKVLAQAKRFSVPDWQTVFAKIAQSPFLKGDNRQGWRCDFDFILSENNFVKILEGKYDRQ